MADLDDFFAKKDKKRSKVKKFTASELLTSSAPARPAQQQPQQPYVEDVASAPSAVVAQPAPAAAAAASTKKTSTTKKEELDQGGEITAADPGAHENHPAAAATQQQPQQRSTRAPAEQEEEEWGEFEQEKERDYSGLKIQKLQIVDSEEEEEDDSAEHELNEEGELVKREPAGPWNKLASTQQQQSASNAVKVKEAPVVEILPNTAGGVYIPPSMRNKGAAGSGTAGSSSSSRTRTGKKDKGAPDLNSEEFFPTLSAAVAIEQNNFKLKKFEQTERGFTEAKPSRSHSNRMAVGPGEEGPRLNLGNKFNALSNDD